MEKCMNPKQNSVSKQNSITENSIEDPIKK